MISKVMSNSFEGVIPYIGVLLRLLKVHSQHNTLLMFPFLNNSVGYYAILFSFGAQK